MSHPDNCLICNVHPPTGRLENWNILYGIYIGGNVYNDSKGRFPDGEWITTSKLVHLDEQTGHARTTFSNYVLGEKRKEN